MQRRSTDLVGQEHELHKRSRHLRRLKQASHSVGGDAAADAFASFAPEDDPLEVVIGRLLVILDVHAGVFERTL
jgi:hypothetical protein